jgi:hypothetical protein
MSVYIARHSSLFTALTSRNKRTKVSLTFSKVGANQQILPGIQIWILLFGSPYHLHVPIVLKSGSLCLLEPSGPVQACKGIALLLPLLLIVSLLKSSTGVPVAEQY